MIIGIGIWVFFFYIILIESIDLDTAFGNPKKRRSIKKEKVSRIVQGTTLKRSLTMLLA
jgi:hypothetical protein